MALLQTEQTLKHTPEKCHWQVTLPQAMLGKSEAPHQTHLPHKHKPITQWVSTAKWGTKLLSLREPICLSGFYREEEPTPLPARYRFFCPEM